MVGRILVYLKRRGGASRTAQVGPAAPCAAEIAKTAMGHSQANTGDCTARDLWRSDTKAILLRSRRSLTLQRARISRLPLGCGGGPHRAHFASGARFQNDGNPAGALPFSRKSCQVLAGSEFSAHFEEACQQNTPLFFFLAPINRN